MEGREPHGYVIIIHCLCTPGEIRTHGLWIRNPSLYPTELPGFCGAEITMFVRGEKAGILFCYKISRHEFSYGLTGIFIIIEHIINSLGNGHFYTMF